MSNENIIHTPQAHFILKLREKIVGEIENNYIEHDYKISVPASSEQEGRAFIEGGLNDVDPATIEEIIFEEVLSA